MIYYSMQFWQAALAFNGGTDLSPVYKPDAPLLSFGTAVLFLLGFLLALFRLRQFKFVMLPIWFLVTVIFGGALLLDPPQSHRLLIALPAITLLAALALVEIIRLITTTLIRSPDHPLTSSPQYLVILVTLLLILGELFFTTAVTPPPPNLPMPTPKPPLKYRNTSIPWTAIGPPISMALR
ncbi:MAG: hypothetical protein HC804_13100 [Anaerolineae bacterium]|nr:hypothetical protein [Anaerolineae bacterium]